jgi:hypothetical protein
MIPVPEDWLEVLADCPVPIDDLPPRRRELPKKRKSSFSLSRYHPFLLQQRLVGRERERERERDGRCDG